MKTNQQIASQKAIQLSNAAHAAGTWDMHFAAYEASLAARTHCELTQHFVDAARHQSRAALHQSFLESGKAVAA